MDAAVLREKLHQYINTADEQHLTAIYVLVEDKLAQGERKYDEETMNMLYERQENYRNGISKSYTPEEVIERAKQRKK
jgi:hypothetical protein